MGSFDTLKESDSLFYLAEEVALDRSKVHPAVDLIASEYFELVTVDGIFAKAGKPDPRHRFNLMGLYLKGRMNVRV